MRLHVPALPHTRTTKDYSWCAFTEKVRKFADMMASLGHEVIVYGTEGTDGHETEHVVVISDDEYAEWFGHIDWTSEMFGGFNLTDPWWQVMNSRVIREISRRAAPDDILGLIMGRCQEPLAQAFPEMLPTEWGIGYEGVFADYRVYESHAWMHYLYGRYGINDGRNYDAVIPNAVDFADLPAGRGDGAYFVYLGRCIARKGPNIAGEVCKRLGAKLLVAGQGVTREEPGLLVCSDGTRIEGDVEYVGTVNPTERAELLGGAIAAFMPTLYLEPWGGVGIEAMACGTPVLSSDWGGFSEWNVEGLTGFRCRTLAQWVDAALSVSHLDRDAIRAHSLRYATEEVRHLYDAYFTRLVTLRGAGWYTLDEGLAPV